MPELLCKFKYSGNLSNTGVLHHYTEQPVLMVQLYNIKHCCAIYYPDKISGLILNISAVPLKKAQNEGITTPLKYIQLFASEHKANILKVDGVQTTNYLTIDKDIFRSMERLVTSELVKNDNHKKMVSKSVYSLEDEIIKKFRGKNVSPAQISAVIDRLQGDVNSPKGKNINMDDLIRYVSMYGSAPARAPRPVQDSPKVVNTTKGHPWKEIFVSKDHTVKATEYVISDELPINNNPYWNEGDGTASDTQRGTRYTRSKVKSYFHAHGDVKASENVGPILGDEIVKFSDEFVGEFIGEVESKPMRTHKVKKRGK